MLITTNGFLAWVKTMPPEETFNFNNSYRCATARYLRSLLSAFDKEFNSITIDVRINSYLINKKRYDFPPFLASVFETISDERTGINIIISFGDLATRIETALQKES